jgi:hypothetical protein
MTRRVKQQGEAFCLAGEVRLISVVNDLTEEERQDEQDADKSPRQYADPA